MLTIADAVCLEKYWDKLCRMMEMAGVPSLRGVNWFHIQTEAGAFDDDYPVWLHTEKRIFYIEFDDSSCLLAKL